MAEERTLEGIGNAPSLPLSSYLAKEYVSGKIFNYTLKTHTFQVGIYFNSKWKLNTLPYSQREVSSSVSSLQCL